MRASAGKAASCLTTASAFSNIFFSLLPQSTSGPTRLSKTLDRRTAFPYLAEASLYHLRCFLYTIVIDSALISVGRACPSP